MELARNDLGKLVGRISVGSHDTMACKRDLLVFLGQLKGFLLNERTHFGWKVVQDFFQNDWAL